MSPSLFSQASRKGMVICCRPKTRVNINISCLTQLLYLVYWSALLFPFLFLCTEGGQINRFTAFIYVSSPQHQFQRCNKNSYFFPFLCKGAKCKSQSSSPHPAQSLWIKYAKIETWRCCWKGCMQCKSPAVLHVTMPSHILLPGEKPMTSLFHHSYILPWLVAQLQKKSNLLSHHADPL